MGITALQVLLLKYTHSFLFLLTLDILKQVKLYSFQYFHASKFVLFGYFQASKAAFLYFGYFQASISVLLFGYFQ